MAAGGGEDGDADLHARTGDEAALDGLLDAEIRTTCVTDCGNAGIQRSPHPSNCLIKAQRKRFCQLLLQIEPLHCKMNVGVNQAR